MSWMYAYCHAETTYQEKEKNTTICELSTSFKKIKMRFSSYSEVQFQGYRTKEDQLSRSSGNTEFQEGKWV